jgi:RHH-type proline utilization regulon transcriptional repressor/proline dehydrogenase/delta 1-pyrroline-5-carboxylate dehydrogenase
MAICVQEARKTIPTRSAKCARRSISAVIMRRRRAAACSRSSFRADRRAQRACGWKGAASGSASRPWNFRSPSSWGQVTAALVAGNTVIAKPAPQTPEIARAAVELAYRAGVPRDALVFAPGGPDWARR